MNADKYHLKHHIFFIFFIAINQIVISLIHYFIYKTGLLLIPSLNDYKILFGSALILLSGSFVVGNIFLYVGHNHFLGKAYHLSAIWLGTMFWLFWAAVFSRLAYFFFGSIVSYDNLSDFAITLYVGAFVLSAYGLYHQKDTKVLRLDLKIKDLPESWIGKKLLHFTDTHYGPVHTLFDANKLAKLLKKENADIICMTGDFYDGPPTNFVTLGEAFKEVLPPLGKYFVAGNHEEYAGYATAISGVEAGGFTVLDGKIKNVEGLQIVGIPYKNHETNASIADMLETLGYQKSLPSVALKHVPNDLKSLAEKDIDLVLCGHTHNGQIWPFNFLARWVYKGYEYGLKTLGTTQVYTSSGVGTWGPPQRIGTQSEIVVFTLNSV